MKEHGGLHERKITIYRAKQDCAEAMARVETDPSLPHRGLARDYRRHLFHSCFKRWIARPELWAKEREGEVGDAKGQGDRGTGGN